MTSTVGEGRVFPVNIDGNIFEELEEVEDGYKEAVGCRMNRLMLRQHALLHHSAVPTAWVESREASPGPMSMSTSLCFISSQASSTTRASPPKLAHYSP